MSSGQLQINQELIFVLYTFSPQLNLLFTSDIWDIGYKAVVVWMFSATITASAESLKYPFSALNKENAVWLLACMFPFYCMSWKSYDSHSRPSLRVAATLERQEDPKISHCWTIETKKTNNNGVI